MYKFLIIISAISYLCCLSYQLGRSQAKITILEKEVQHEQTISHKKSIIYSRPNASHLELLSLFKNNIL